MSDSPSRLIRTADPTQPSIPHRKIPGTAPPVRIFKHDWMERLTFISFRSFLIFCVLFESIAVGCAIYYSTSFWQSLAYASAGIPLWLLTEYILHRFFFHFDSQYVAIQRLVYIFHGNHHIQPNHPYRTLMPISVTLPVGLAIWALMAYSLGMSKGSALFTGFLAGYGFYDCIHFATHNFSMKRFPFSLWKQHHLLHHYQVEEHNYSISLPWLDTLFRTKYKR